MNTKKMKTLHTFIKPTIICLTPVRNEAWILERFLQATSLWADYIIIADQMSSDGSREIARKYPKVILVDNNTEEFNEPERQRLLISEARKIEGPRLLITLDADEMFTPNVLTSSEWQVVLNAELGTVFKFQWANITPDLNHFWYGHYFPWGYMDDGYEHNYNNKLHNYRIPFPADAKSFEIKEIKVIHFQFTDWNRMLCKHRWYQCLEVINYPDKSAIDIYRQYHHMDEIDKIDIFIIPTEWINDYKSFGINILQINKEEKIWYDEQTLKLFDSYGIEKFKKIDIWDVNWDKKKRLWNFDNSFMVQNPQSLKNKVLILWLKFSQNKIDKKIFRRLDRVITKLVNKYN
jgi:hypothetical protein